MSGTIYTLADGRIVSQAEFYASFHGEAFGQLIKDGYRVDRSRGIDALSWKLGVRGTDGHTLDDVLPPPLGADPLPFGGSAPRFGDPPGFIARRFHTRGDGTATLLQKRKEAWRMLAHEFVKDGYPRLREIASLESLRDSIQAELNHRAVRAALVTNTLRCLWAVPVVEAAYRFSQMEHVSEEDRGALQNWRMAWDEVREGATVEAVLKRVTYWTEVSPFLDRGVSGVQAKALNVHLYFREPELELAESLAIRLGACEKILRAAAYGWKVIAPGAGTEPPFHVRLGGALFEERLRDSAFSKPTFSAIGEFCEWASAKLPELGLDPGSIRKKLVRSGHWTRAERGPSRAVDVEALLERLVAEMHDWERRFE